MNLIRNKKLLTPDFINFFLEIWNKKYLIYQLVKRDFFDRFIDSYLGLLWAILDPLATTLILAFVFSFGLKTGTVQDIPFFLYMLSGMVVFNFFSVAVGEGTNLVRSFSFLVKKIDFQLSILAIVKLISATIVHLIMLLILFATLFYFGYYPKLFWFQLIYYYIGLTLLILGTIWLFSSINVFIPDMSSVVSISLRFLFYLSPIFWSTSVLPQKFIPLIKLNPLHYIITGYRDSLIYAKPFWLKPAEGFYYWVFALLTIFLGALVFRRLKPHFADVI